MNPKPEGSKFSWLGKRSGSEGTRSQLIKVKTFFLDV